MSERLSIHQKIVNDSKNRPETHLVRKKGTYEGGQTEAESGSDSARSTVVHDTSTKWQQPIVWTRADIVQESGIVFHVQLRPTALHHDSHLRQVCGLFDDNFQFMWIFDNHGTKANENRLRSALEPGVQFRKETNIKIYLLINDHF